MSIQIISHSEATADSDEITINKPANVQNGDILVAHISNNGSFGTTPPAGWTEEYDQEDDGDETQIALLWKVITNAGGEPANYTFELAGSTSICGAITCLRGVDTTDPWQTDDNNSDEDSSPIAPTVTAAKNNSMLLCFVTMADGQTFTPPGGMAEQYDFANGSNVSCTMAYLEVNAGATGTKEFDSSGDDWWIAVSAILNPAPAGGYLLASSV